MYANADDLKMTTSYIHQEGGGGGGGVPLPVAMSDEDYCSRLHQFTGENYAECPNHLAMPRPSKTDWH